MKGKIVLFAFLLCCLFSVGSLHMVYAAQPAGDITDTGIDFLTNPPQQEVTYTAGQGTVTYTPETDGSAVITMENASINGSVKGVLYQSPNRASAALFARGKIDLVLIGENTITVTEKGTQGVFLYDSDVTVKGTGSLIVDTTAITGYGPSPFNVMAGKDTNEATRTGHFTQEGGNIAIKANAKDPGICFLVSNDLTIGGGSLTTEGGSYGIVCSKGTLSIAGAVLSAGDFPVTVSPIIKGIFSFPELTPPSKSIPPKKMPILLV